MSVRVISDEMLQQDCRRFLIPLFVDTAQNHPNKANVMRQSKQGNFNPTYSTLTTVVAYLTLWLVC